MTGNYFKVEFRLLVRQKGYTLLNVAGLMLGIAVFVFIYLFVESEVRYDRYWACHEQIYRITNEYSLDGKSEKIALTPFRLAQDLRTEFTGVEESTNLFFTDPADENDVSTVIYNGEVFEIPDISLADGSFFNIFDYPFLEGNADSALEKPNSIVINLATARKIFGNQSAMGKNLRTNLREYTVTGVIDKSTKPSHLNFDAIVSVSSLNDRESTALAHDYFWMTCYTYVKLNDTVDPADFEYRFNEFERRGEAAFIQEEKLNVVGSMQYFFENVSMVHFNSGLMYDSPTNVDVDNLYVFAIIALFILLTASINYINLATARSLKRSREIGMRKVLGAGTRQLAVQYIVESLIITIIAFVLALSLVEWLMPQFNLLVGKKLSLIDSLVSGGNYFFGIALLVLILLLSVIGGSFPAFVLNSFKPAHVLRGTSYTAGRFGKQQVTAGIMRHFLVIIQYVVSIGMIMATLIIYAQISFLKHHELGFDEENVFVINVPRDTLFRKQIRKTMEILKHHPAVLEVSGTQNVPGYTEGKMLFQVGDTNVNPVQTINYFGVGYRFFKLLNIPLVEGRYFHDEPGDDTATSFILNEAAVAFLNLDTAVGTPFNFAGAKGGKIVGVVRNFNSSSLHRDVDPVVFMLVPRMARYFMVKAVPDRLDEAESHIRQVWSGIPSAGSLHIISLESKISGLYSGDKKMLNLFFYFSLFVVFISSLGLYGLSSFLIQQRTREIGIRRVLGGSEKQLITMLSMGYLKLVFLSGLIATPIVYLLMKKWLDGFAYHISIHAGFFIGSILLALLLAFLTVLLRSVKVVKEHPASALKVQ
ncbi:MAG: ABC transporter permease [Bacteroidales bacterium]|nr:ABC transporter permease [Bacteroidales bacterium]